MENAFQAALKKREKEASAYGGMDEAAAGYKRCEGVNPDYGRNLHYGGRY